jgi:hypothetical protein
MRNVWTLMLLSVLAASRPVAAEERIDVGLLLGATKATDEGTVLQFGKAKTFQATLAWHVWSGDRVALAIEIPFLASPAFEVTTPGAVLPKEYASLYLTPGVRVTWPARGMVSVFGAVGGGYARYSESKLRANDSPNPGQLDTNTGAFQIGGGVDVRGFGWLGFRGEVRDIVTGARRFSIATPGGTVHNVATSGGLVVRF